MSYLDTRDLYAELADLDARAEWDDEDDENPDPLDESEQERRTALRELFDEIGEDAGRYGETMIPDYAFTEYAEDLADDLGLIDSSNSWPNCHIDWQAAANSLRQDYTEVTFDGTDYLIRL
jgi:hypothetical protein